MLLVILVYPLVPLFHSVFLTESLYSYFRNLNIFIIKYIHRIYNTYRLYGNFNTNAINGVNNILASVLYTEMWARIETL